MRACRLADWNTQSQQQKHEFFRMINGLIFSPQSTATSSCFLIQWPVEPLKWVSCFTFMINRSVLLVLIIYFLKISLEMTSHICTLTFFPYPSQVVVVEATTITQGGADAHGAAGYEAHTDVIPLFQTILTFVSSGHIYSITFLSRRADLKSVICFNCEVQTYGYQTREDLSKHCYQTLLKSK